MQDRYLLCRSASSFSTPLWRKLIMRDAVYSRVIKNFDKPIDHRIGPLFVVWSTLKASIRWLLMCRNWDIVVKKQDDAEQTNGLCCDRKRKDCGQCQSRSMMRRKDGKKTTCKNQLWQPWCYHYGNFHCNYFLHDLEKGPWKVNIWVAVNCYDLRFSSWQLRVTQELSSSG